MPLIIAKLFSEDSISELDTAVAAYKAGAGSDLADHQRAMCASAFIEPDGDWRHGLCLFHGGLDVPTATNKTADLQHVTVAKEGSVAEMQAAIDEVLADAVHSSATDIDTTVAGTITTASSLFEAEDVGRKFRIGDVEKTITAYTDANNVDYDDAAEGAFASGTGQTGYLLGAEVIQAADMEMDKGRGELRLDLTMAIEGELP